MEEVLNFLKENPVFYIATVEKNQPRVRPFGAIALFEGKLYFCTNNKKKVFAQISENPRIEICGMNKNGVWMRVEAKAVRDDRTEAREAVLKDNPSLNRMYKVDDGIFEVLYFKDAVATFYSYTGEPKTVKF